MDAKTLVLILVPFAFLAGGIAVFLAFSRSLGVRAFEEGAEAERFARPWWGSPLVWIGACAMLALLGLVVAPRLFGVFFLFLPLIWIGRFHRRQRR
ncbi:MAG: hypothetical protein ACRDHS_04490 [Actinomycetota bacterium]